jgi:hypothetical protein
MAGSGLVSDARRPRWCVPVNIASEKGLKASGEVLSHSGKKMDFYGGQREGKRNSYLNEIRSKFGGFIF